MTQSLALPVKEGSFGSYVGIPRFSKIPEHLVKPLFDFIGESYDEGLAAVLYGLAAAAWHTQQNKGRVTKLIVSMSPNGYALGKTEKRKPFVAFRSMEKAFQWIKGSPHVKFTRGMPARNGYKGMLSNAFPEASLKVCLLDFAEKFEENAHLLIVAPMQNDRISLRNSDTRDEVKTSMAAYRYLRRELVPRLELINDTFSKFAYSIDDFSVSADTLKYFRVFSDSEEFNQGGRFYSAAQSWPKATRRRLRINNEATIELDFKALHPSMLYHKRGLVAPNDPYEIPGLEHIERDIRKIFLNIMLNAESDKAVVASFTNRRSRREFPQEPVQGWKSAIESYHAPIANYFCSAAWRHLQFLDSCIAECVMLGLAERNIGCLAIHDSFVVPASAIEVTEQLMIDAYQQVLGTNFIPQITRKLV